MAKFLAIGYDGQTFTNNGWLFTFGSGLDVLSWLSTTTRDGRVTETFTLVAAGSDAAIIAAYNDLVQGIEYVRLYSEMPNYYYPIWLYMNGEDELPKRSLILNMSILPVSSGLENPLLGFGSALYTLQIERMPWWEPCTEFQWPSGVGFTITNALGVGSKQTVRNLVPGDVPGRIWRMRFTYKTSAPGATSGMLNKWWVGIMPFRSDLELDSGSYELRIDSAAVLDGTCVDASSAADATAIGGSKVSVSFATQTALRKRAYATARPNKRGRYLVLARCHITAGSHPATVHLRMYYGPVESGGGVRPVESVYFAPGDNNWHWVELGEIATGESTYERLEVWAERLTSGTTLAIDHFAYIPSEVLLKCWNVQADEPNRRSTNFYCREDGVMSIDNMSTIDEASQFTARNWRMPTLGGVVVFVGESYNYPNDLTHNIRIEGSIRPCWSGHREV